MKVDGSCMCGGFNRAKLNEEVLRRAREVVGDLHVKDLQGGRPRVNMLLERLADAIKAVDDYEGSRNMLDPNPEGCPQPF